MVNMGSSFATQTKKCLHAFTRSEINSEDSCANRDLQVEHLEVEGWSVKKNLLDPNVDVKSANPS